MMDVPIVDEKKFRPKNKRRSWALLGFLLAAALAVIAAALAPTLTVAIDNAIPRLRLRGPLQAQATLLVGFITWLLLITVAGLIVAATAPRRAINVRDEHLVKERAAMARQKRFERKRQRELNRQFREYREGRASKPRR